MRGRQILVIILLLAVVGGLVAMRVNAKNAKDALPAQTSTTVTTYDIDATATTRAPESDWRASFDRVIRIQNELLQNPDTSRIGEAIDPSCACYAETERGLQTLAGRKWHVKGDFLKPTAVALVSETSSERHITAGFVGNNAPTVDSTGKIVEKGQTGALKPVLYVLKKNTKGVWLVTERTPYEEQ